MIVQESESESDDEKANKDKTKDLKNKKKYNQISLKEKEKQRKEKAEKKRLRDINPDSLKYQFYEETFRISRYTDIRQFLVIVCDYWGLSLLTAAKPVYLFDDNGEKINYNYKDNVLLDNTFMCRTMDKIMESVMVKDLKDKELFPSGTRRY